MGFLDKIRSTLSSGLSESADNLEHSDRRQSNRVNARPGTKMLIIDDSKTVCVLLKKMLIQNQYEVGIALDAEAGLKLAKQHLPDLIFLDIVLPGINGFQALRELRKDPKTQNIPVIMISGNVIATEKYYAERIGADDFMKKPFSRYEVFHRIENFIGPDKRIRRTSS
ncbi:hypothetical protein GCM10009123_02020 [Kangiella japonica]|uniref:Response regulatory domain-containing protein n=1 Tax=Kangiella japonica TaxID=647384 RepID=A0ABN0STH4_9GAMM